MISYSFIPPKQKPIMSLMAKMFTLGTGFVLAWLILVDVAINFNTFNHNRSALAKERAYDEYVHRIALTKSQIGVIKTQRDAVLDIHSNNVALKTSLKNLFDLVPDTITLNDVYMDREALVIRGDTPSKEAYNLLMDAPLKSIFATTEVSFNKRKNGWYGFVSKSHIENPEGFNE